MCDAIQQLCQDLQRAPVMGNIHPLVPLCLPADVEVTDDAETLVEQLDDPTPHRERPVLITRLDPRYRGRFLEMHLCSCPPADAINRGLPRRIGDARRRLLTHKGIADRIVSDSRRRGYQVVAFLLVDGLSYDDVKEWPEQVEPCFVDGPSITHGRAADGGVAPDIGFPGIVGGPPLAHRLLDVGIPHSRGYSYWDREQNDVSKVLFQGTPLCRVSGIADALDVLAAIKLPGMYLQLVREGLDGLAHSRREVTANEIRATVDAVHADFRRLANLVALSGARGAVYLAADHGILWKSQHELSQIEGTIAEHPRYASACAPDSAHSAAFHMHGQVYYLYHYPYLGARMRRNDSGVHGGLSYWESIVPFVRVEVNS